MNDHRNLESNATFIDAPRPVMFQISFALFILSLLVLVFMLGAFSLQTLGMVEYWRSKGPTHGSSRKIRWLLYGMSFNGMVCSALIASVGHLTFLDLMSCQILIKFVVLTYFIMVQLSFLFFLEKAKLVSRFEKGKRFLLLEKLVNLGVLFALPFGLVPISIAFVESAVSIEGYCLFIVPSALTLSFLPANLILAVVLLVIFVYPLWNAGKVDTEHAHFMKTVAVRQARISSLAIIVSTLCLVIFLAFQEFAQYDKRLQYYFVSSTLLTVIDILNLAVCALIMTSIWQPECIRSRTSRHSSKMAASTSPPTSTSKPKSSTPVVLAEPPV